MTEGAGVFGATGTPATGAGAARAARAQYGVVFAELPPRRRSTPRRKPGPSPRPRLEQPRPSPAPGTVGRSHGTYAKAVVEGCTCQGCAAARREYNRRRDHAIARPDEVWLPYVSADPARAHLGALAQAGVGLKTVATLSGVSTGCLSKIVYGDRRRRLPPSRRIRPETLRRVLAVKATDATGGQRVPAGPTWVLLDELLAAGHTRTALARALGASGTTPSLQVGLLHVRASTAWAVEELHGRLIGRPAPKRASRWSP